MAEKDADLQKEYQDYIEYQQYLDDSIITGQAAEGRAAEGWKKLGPAIGKALDYTDGLTRAGVYSAPNPSIAMLDMPIETTGPAKQADVIAALKGDGPSSSVYLERSGIPKPWATVLGFGSDVMLSPPVLGTLARVARPASKWGKSLQGAAKVATAPVSEVAQATGRGVYDSSVKNINKVLEYDKGAAPLTEILAAEGRPAFRASKLPSLLDDLTDKLQSRQRAVYDKIAEKGPRRPLDYTEVVDSSPVVQRGLPLEQGNRSPIATDKSFTSVQTQTQPGLSLDAIVTGKPFKPTLYKDQPYVPMQQTAVIPEQPDMFLVDARKTLNGQPLGGWLGEGTTLHTVKFPGRPEEAIGSEVWYPHGGAQFELPIASQKRTPIYTAVDTATVRTAEQPGLALEARSPVAIDSSVDLPGAGQVQLGIPMETRGGYVDFGKPVRDAGEKYISKFKSDRNLKDEDKVLKRLRDKLDQYTEQRYVEPHLAGRRKSILQKEGQRSYIRDAVDPAATPEAELSAIMGTAGREALETAAEQTERGLGGNLADINRKLQTLMYSETPAAQQVKREITKNLVTAVDAPLAFFSPKAALAKKAAEWSALTGPRTYGGKGLMLLGKSLLPDAVARQATVWSLRE